MQVPKKLEQFEEKTLLIISGQQTARLYFAHKGRARLLKEIETEAPQYSDRGGHFKRSGRQTDLSQGSVYKSKKEKMRKGYLRVMEKELGKIFQTRKIERIYLYAPQTISRDLRESLPHRAGDLVKRTFRGNFLHESPIELIEKINQARQGRASRQRRSMAKPEARKILNKGRRG